MRTCPPSPSIVPYWRLSNFYFFYFASLGALLPYWGLYLQSLGFNPREIGQLMATLVVTKVVSPNILGWLADRWGKGSDMVRIVALASLATFIGVYFLPASGGDGDYWRLLFLMTVFGFFWNAILPQMEVITLSHLGKDAQRYPRVRLWGSVGFILAVLVLGVLSDRYDIDLLPHGVLVTLVGIALATLLIADQDTLIRHHATLPFFYVLRQPRVLALLASGFLAQASHGPFYTFYSIYLDNYGYSQSLIGGLWALGVGAEVALFALMPLLLSRFSLRTLLLWSLALTVIRWLLVASTPHNVPIQVLAQLLHAATFGLFHGVTILYVNRFFAGHQIQGQALYNSIAWGAGAGVGTLVSGHLWSTFGGPITYLGAAGVGGIAFFVTWRWIHEGGGGR